MAKLTRPRVGEEVLELECCPCCGANEISVGDCGYSSFNPGWAECKNCKRKWSFSCVNDSWQVGELWNAKAKAIRRKFAMLIPFTSQAVTKDEKAFAKELEAFVIDADKKAGER